MNEITPCIFIKNKINPGLIEMMILHRKFLKISPRLQDVIIVNVKRGMWSTYIDE